MRSIRYSCQLLGNLSCLHSQMYDGFDRFWPLEFSSLTSPVADICGEASIRYSCPLLGCLHSQLYDGLTDARDTWLPELLGLTMILLDALISTGYLT